MLNDINDNGFIRVEDSTSSVYKIRVQDFKGNETWVNIPIKGKKAKEKTRTI